MCASTASTAWDICCLRFRFRTVGLSLVCVHSSLIRRRGSYSVMTVTKWLCGPRRPESLGYKNVHILTGGAEAWQRAGYMLLSRGQRANQSVRGANRASATYASALGAIRSPRSKWRRGARVRQSLAGAHETACRLVGERKTKRTVGHRERGQARNILHPNDWRIASARSHGSSAAKPKYSPSR